MAKNTGFSLIEMLISIGILMTIVGVGIASFLTFNDRQVVLNAGKDVQGQIKAAKAKAQAGDTPEGCTRLEGYAVRISANGPRSRLLAVCENDDYLDHPVDFPTGVTSTDTIDITFLGLHGGVQGAETVTIQSDKWAYAFDITSGGEVSEGEMTAL